MKERLLEAKKQQEENRKLCGRSYNKEYLGYVCVDVIGNLIKPNYVSSTFGKLLAKNNLRHIRFHDLRHTCASPFAGQRCPDGTGKRSGWDTVRSQQRWIFTGICNMPRKKQSAAAIEQDIVAPMLQNLSAVSPLKKERGLPAFRWQTSWRRWRDSNSRAGFEPTYRISSADPSTAWVHLQIYVISLVPTRRPIQPVEIRKNNRIEQATLFNLNSAGTRMVPRVSAVWHSA